MSRILLLIIFLHLPLSALEITRHGVTWTITGTPTSGTYANGDPWVEGPVTITAISPTPSAGRNGAVVNPSLGRTQGYDDRISAYNTYSEALNVGNNLPLVVAVNSSVVSAISDSSSVSWGQVDSYSVLTVVSSSPAANSFRPGYIGTGSRASSFTTADLNYDVLSDLDITGFGAPDLGDVEDRFDWCWYEQDLTWTGRYMHTDFQGLNGYGRNMALQTGEAGLLLNSDLTDGEKSTLLISLVQYGLDIHHIISEGGSWGADGGHNPGRLLPAAVAAMVLEDSGLQANIAGSALKFQEYQQTFYVTSGDVALTHSAVNGAPTTQYDSGDIGLEEWGIRHTSTPIYDNNRWDTPYRDIAGSTMTATSMTIRAMGGQDECDWDEFFEYAARHVDYETSGASYGGEFSSNPTPGFAKNWYAAYADVTGPGGGDPDVTAPMISNVSVTPGDDSAMVTWTTDEAASSRVDYGATDSYGSNETSAQLTTSHSVEITGLSAATEYHFKVTSVDSSANSAESADDTFTTSAETVDDPEADVAAGRYWDELTVALSTGTSGAAIYYTQDNSTPDSEDSLYSTGLTISATQTLRAIGIKGGASDSAVVSYAYDFGPWSQVGEWDNVTMDGRSEDFSLTIYVLPSGEDTDLVVGFAEGDADGYEDLACIAQLLNGEIKARNGGVYEAEGVVNFTEGQSIGLTFVVDWSEKTYDLTATVNGVGPSVIAEDYAWRTGTTGATELNRIGHYDSFALGAGLGQEEFDFESVSGSATVSGTLTIGEVLDSLLVYQAVGTGGEDFEGISSLPDGWTFVDDTYSDATLTVEDGKAKIAIPGGSSHDPGTGSPDPGEDTPRIERVQADEDFDFVVAFAVDGVALAGYGTGSTGAGYGIYVRWSDNSTARHDCYFLGKSTAEYCNVRSAGAQSITDRATVSSTYEDGVPPFMRLVRSGNDFSFQVSFTSNPGEWHESATYSTSGAVEALGAYGLNIGGASAPAVEIEIEEIRTNANQPEVNDPVTRTSVLSLDGSAVPAGPDWSDDSADGGTITTSSGELTMGFSTTARSTARFISTSAIGPNCGCLVKVREDTASTNHFFGVGLRIPGGWITQYGGQGPILEIGTSSPVARLVKQSDSVVQTADDAFWSWSYPFEGAVPAHPLTSTATWVRYEAIGPVFRVRFWQDGDSEPSTWDAEYTDHTFYEEGYVGVAFSKNDSDSTAAEAILEEITFYEITK